ncbi:MAG: cysteate synthase [Acidobacteria bacterium]|nr:cysteate synthase [Acidobacteriota bacterium]
MEYEIFCPTCGAIAEDDGAQLECERCRGTSLLQCKFKEPKLPISESEHGIFRYRKWLPVRRVSLSCSGGAFYRSKGLAKELGLRNLWISFNGFWPEKGSTLQTGTFKDIEAACVLSRRAETDNRVLVVASAGNTASAFIAACSQNEIRCVIVIPERGLKELRIVGPVGSDVNLVVLADPADYFDAIEFSRRLTVFPDFVLEGGVRNVARRAGLATVLLQAYEALGCLPEYYFQAISSGCGAIAVYEYSRRIAGDKGRVPKLLLSQNSPFAPIYRAWLSRSRTFIESDKETARLDQRRMIAPVLGNRTPPYSLAGGVFDTLEGSGGDVKAVTNEAAIAAAKLFQTAEGIDIELAAAVAVANLIGAVQRNGISPDAVICLNITGGGKSRLANSQRSDATLSYSFLLPKERNANISRWAAIWSR